MFDRVLDEPLIDIVLNTPLEVVGDILSKKMKTNYLESIFIKIL